MNRYCFYCFLPEEECHDHKFIEFPEKCLCDKGEWLAFADEEVKIPLICNNFTSKGGNCVNCEHDKECHE